ncbi:hypothetical protein [Haloarchaeobius sp. TZWSO28]|uniref:hypothetical protein n=1 Tax=Haloarchaeobius sp. TZWSO28 TaxID=3446119 RepID=UPI003EBDD620
MLSPTELDRHFPRYSSYDPDVPVWCATPDDTGYIHRFFNSSPLSPSGRYLALTKFPYEDWVPTPGDEAEIVVVDLATGDRAVVATTAGWDTQMGSHVQWGADDNQLFFNDVDTDEWDAFGVKLDPETGARTELDAAVYHVAPDGKRVASPDLLITSSTQDGYGVIAPDDLIPRHDGAPDDDGLYVTDTTTGESELVASLANLVDVLDVDRTGDGEGGYYGFHTEWAPDGDRLFFVVRYRAHDADYWDWIPHLVTMRPDGSEPQLAVPGEAWARGGHHVNWTPDGERILMNLRLEDDGPLRFVSFRPDGTDRRTISDREGSGHPSLHPNGRTLITDAYLHETFADDDGSVPIRALDLETDTETEPVRIPSKPSFSGPYNMLRVDPHPAWGPSHRYVVFNGCDDGKRRVYIADFESVIHSG